MRILFLLLLVLCAVSSWVPSCEGLTMNNCRKLKDNQCRIQCAMVVQGYAKELSKTCK
ncbi:hypothetical protein FKM82_022418 [Ascaphus truei]